MIAYRPEINERQAVVHGVVEVCCHRVAWRYWQGFLNPRRRGISDELVEQLEREAEERAQHCIIEGCCCGDLNCLYVHPDGKEREIRGWWEILND